MRGWCEYRLASLYETRNHEVVTSSPDKVDQKYAGERNRVVWFLATQKSPAIEAISDRFLHPENKRSPAERAHAACRLAAVLGRRVRHDSLDHVKAWLRQKPE